MKTLLFTLIALLFSLQISAPILASNKITISLVSSSDDEYDDEEGSEEEQENEEIEENA